MIKETVKEKQERIFNVTKETLKRSERKMIKT